MDRYHLTIKIGNQTIINGFLLMMEEKRMITLKDNSAIKNLENSQSLKQIIFCIWINLKYKKNLYQIIQKKRKKMKEIKKNTYI